MHGELLARVLERDNLRRALKRVRANQGAPGIDGMGVDELAEYLKHHWLEIRASIVAGHYRPQPVRRVEIPKPDGRKRMLGIPTVLDRFIQQAIARESCKRNGSHISTRTATDFGPSAARIKRCARCRPMCATGTTGWLISIWRVFSIGSTTTG